ncbi:MAG TPA: glycosyltransferase family 4 protein [Kofleriaceae bacterium]|nr:glycosyltransferase family 4 protein [Kofleriaceae bacterium]
MRILYLSLSYVPSRRASSVQVMKMCSALARQGHEVVLVVKAGPAAEAARAADDFAFYGVEPSFRIEKLPRPARRGGGAVYAAAMARRLVEHRRWADLVYCRDPVGGACASLLRMPLVFEAHGLPGNRLQRAMWRQMTGSRGFVAMVAISDALRRDILAEGLLPDGRDCIVAHDAADVPERAPSAGRAANGRPHVGYVGNLYKGRGIELLLEVARRMPEADFDVVGGSEADIARWRAASPPANLLFHGFHPHSELGPFYDRFDLVVMPHSRDGVVGASGSSDISRWTSPMKMFEYMASGLPMVASDLPVLQEVLRHGQNALIARSDDTGDWIEKIRALIADPDLGARLARTAQEELHRDHTWDARASHVINQLPGLGAKASGSPEATPV